MSESGKPMTEERLADITKWVSQADLNDEWSTDQMQELLDEILRLREENEKWRQANIVLVDENLKILQEYGVQRP